MKETVMIDKRLLEVTHNILSQSKVIKTCPSCQMKVKKGLNFEIAMAQAQKYYNDQVLLIPVIGESIYPDPNIVYNSINEIFTTIPNGCLCKTTYKSE